MGKIKFHLFWTPWKNLFGYPWKNPLFPHGKNFSDAHVQSFVHFMSIFIAICSLPSLDTTGFSNGIFLTQMHILCVQWCGSDSVQKAFEILFSAFSEDVLLIDEQDIISVVDGSVNIISFLPWNFLRWKVFQNTLLVCQ